MTPEPTLDEARALPTFYRVARISHTSYSCERCAEHRREPWVDGTACAEHTVETVALAYNEGKGRNRYQRTIDANDARLALAVLRAGGNPEPLTQPGTLAHAQWTYKPKGRKSDRLEIIRALTREPATRQEVAA